MAEILSRRGACQMLLASAGCVADILTHPRGRQMLRASALPGPARATTEERGDERMQARGPLKVHPTNPRYFTDGSGKAVYLAGSHNWANLVDLGETILPRSSTTPSTSIC